MIQNTVDNQIQNSKNQSIMTRIGNLPTSILIHIVI